MIFEDEIIEGALSRLRQLLAIESPLKIMKNDFYFTSKALWTKIAASFCLKLIALFLKMKIYLCCCNFVNKQINKNS